MVRSVKIDLHEVLNPACRRCRNRDERCQDDNTGFCDEAVSVVDGGPVRCVGDWATQKLHFLTQYVGIFGPGMKNMWGGHVHYVEICSGPGRCLMRDSGIEVDGTPLAVLQHPAFPSFETATFLDFDAKVVVALNERIARLNLQGKAQAYQADYCDPGSLVRILRKRFDKGISLVFVDPTDCSVLFAAVALLAKALRPADLIINMAVRTDATRNVTRAINCEDSESRAKYISFLGSDLFFQDPQVQELARLGSHSDLRAKFRHHYCESMRSIGYQHFDFQPVKHYYDLLFASRHEQGIIFWHRAQKYRHDGQSTFL